MLEAPGDCCVLQCCRGLSSRSGFAAMHAVACRCTTFTQRDLVCRSLLTNCKFTALVGASEHPALACCL